MYPHSQILPWSLSLNLVIDEVEFLFFGIPQCLFPKLVRKRWPCGQESYAHWVHGERCLYKLLTVLFMTMRDIEQDSDYQTYKR